MFAPFACIYVRILYLGHLIFTIARKALRQVAKEQQTFCRPQKAMMNHDNWIVCIHVNAGHAKKACCVKLKQYRTCCAGNKPK